MSVSRGILGILRCAEFAVCALAFAGNGCWDAIGRAVLVALLAFNTDVRRFAARRFTLTLQDYFHILLVWRGCV